MTLNLSGDEICSVNTEEFWFERCPAKRKVLSVVPLAYFERKKLRSKRLSGLIEKFQPPFNRHPKHKNNFLVFWSANF